LDAEVSEKLNEADEIDEAEDKKIEEMLKPLREKSDYNKVMAFNEPMWMVFVACFAVAAAGFCQPAFGWIFSRMMTVLTVPVKFAKLAL
jgi:hypothetical protein